MEILDKVLPGGFDVGCVAVVGQVEDLQADVIVTGGVGVLVEELESGLVSAVLFFLDDARVDSSRLGLARLG